MAQILGRRTLELIDIPSVSRAEADLRNHVSEVVPLRAVYATDEALLFAADRAHHVDSLIRPALERAFAPGMPWAGEGIGLLAAQHPGHQRGIALIHGALPKTVVVRALARRSAETG